MASPGRDWPASSIVDRMSIKPTGRGAASTDVGAHRSGRLERRVLHAGLPFRVLNDRSSPESARPPVVLVHGIGMSHRYLSRLHDALTADGPVFSIDLPGYAGLPKPGRDVGVEEMARALGEVIRSLDVGAVVLVGHSMGAQWVTEVAVHAPELVSDLVLIGPVTDSEHRSLPAQMQALALDSLREPPVVNAIVFTDYLRCGVRWYLAQVRHMLTYPLEDRLSAVSMPVLIIRGSRDPIAGMAWCRRLRDRASASTLVLVPGQAHVAQHSAPAAVASAIRTHLRRQA